MQALSKTIYWMFMVAVIGLGALLMISILPIPGSIQLKVVESGSMEPAIMTGGIVVDRPAATYNVGDIITFGADTKTQVPTTHRIVAIEGSGANERITTKGDANDAPDPTQTTLAAVHGKVIFTMPYVGYVLNFARQPLGFALLVGVPAFFIILEEIGKIVREIARIRRQKKHQLTHAEHQSQPYRTKVD